MAFHDTELPDGFQYGSQAGVAHATIVQETASGHEWRVSPQAQGRLRLRLITTLLSTEDVRVLQAFQRGRRGSLHSFKVRDFADYSTDTTWAGEPSFSDQILGSGDGVETSFRLVKRYEPGEEGEYVRVLTLPEDGTVVVAIDGVEVDEGTDFTVSDDGVVVFDTAPDFGAVITAGCRFFVPVRFERDLMAVQADAHGVWSIADLDVVEVLNEVEWPERWFTGGFKNWGTVATTIQLSLSGGELHYVNPSAAIDALLPAPNRMPGGPRMLRVVVADGASGSVQLRDDAGNAVGSALSTGNHAEIGLVIDGADAVWVVR